MKESRRDQEQKRYTWVFTLELHHLLLVFQFMLECSIAGRGLFVDFCGFGFVCVFFVLFFSVVFGGRCVVFCCLFLTGKAVGCVVEAAV